MSNELHTMPLKIEALFSSRRVRSLKLDEFGAYMWLLCEAWLEGGRLPSDLEELKASLPRGSEESWQRIEKFVIFRFFRPSEDGRYLINDTQEKIYNDVVGGMKANSERGKLGAETRWGKLKQCSSNAQAVPKHGLSNSNQSQNQSKEISPNGDTKKDGALSLTVPIIPPELAKDEIFLKTWTEWTKFRRSRGKVKDWNTLFRKQLEWLKETDPATAVEVLNKSMRNGWTGLFPLKGGEVATVAQKGEKSYAWN